MQALQRGCDLCAVDKRSQGIPIVQRKFHQMMSIHEGIGQCLPVVTMEMDDSGCQVVSKVTLEKAL